MRLPAYVIRNCGPVSQVTLGNGTILIDTEDLRLLDGGSPELVNGRARLRRPGPPVSCVSIARLVMHASKDARIHFRNADTKDCRKDNLMLLPVKAASSGEQQ